jgi:hypothetical protein
MARDNVAITALTLNGAVAESAGVAISPTNGAVIAAGGNTQRLLIVVKNTSGASRDVTVRAGVNPPAALAGQGDLVASVPATTGVRMFAIESGRFAQENGDIHVDFVTSTAGTIHAYRLPRGL